MTNHAKLIRAVYQMVLQRNPTSVEITYWLHFLSANGTIDEIRADLARTHEFDHELHSLFQKSLSRRAHPDEIMSCRKKVISGRSLVDLERILGAGHSIESEDTLA